MNLLGIQYKANALKDMPIPISNYNSKFNNNSYIYILCSFPGIPFKTIYIII